MRGFLPRSTSRLVGALMLGAVLVPLLPQAQESVLAKQEIGVDTFTVADRRNDQIHPRIDGRFVVWQDYRDVGAYTTDEVNADIYARNLESGDDFRVDANRTSSHPDVSGDLIVYADAREGDADVRAYNVRTDDYFWVIRRAGSSQERPAVDGNTVVWQDNRDGGWDIRARDLSTDDEFWVSRRDGNQFGPRISGRNVVWEDDRDGCCDIYVKNLDSGNVTRITDNNDAHDPDISGNWVVYRGGDERGNVFAYNLDDGERLRLNSNRDEAVGAPNVDGRLVVWADQRNGEDYNVFAFDLETRTEYLIIHSESDQLEPTVSEQRTVWTDYRGDRGAQIRGANLTLPTTQPSPTPSPTTQPGTACPPSTALPAYLRDGRYFAQTGFRIDHDTIWNYFVFRGGVRNFGYPVSRTVMFMGQPTQFFQRQIVQINASGEPRLLNLLDPDMMPATNINFSTYPGVDANVKAETPPVSDPNYATKIIDFTASVAPDFWQGRPVRFFSTFVGQVTLADAYPGGGGNPGLLPLLNLELSGAPISRPAADPANANFVYQRFQRTILHYDATTGITQPVLLADYFKDVLMGRAPADLMNQMAGSRFINQYNPAQPMALNRPDLLTGANLCGAFDPQ